MTGPWSDRLIALDSQTLTPPPALDPPPTVWALASHRAGETSQILALAEGLGWPYATKRVHYRPGIPFFLLGASRLGMDPARSDRLTPPWPDLIISAGARNEPIARWIQSQADRPVRLVHIGRPWAAPRHFDLIITTPQYRLAPAPNILQNTTTLHRVTPQRLEAAARVWAPRLQDLPRPYLAVIIGGNSGPYSFNCSEAVRLAERASELARQRGAALLVSTSARTPRAAAQVLERSLSVPYQMYHWDPDSATNPYYAYLALADELIVTGDSIAMLSEACATGKPVYIADLGTGRQGMRAAQPPQRISGAGCLDRDWLRRSIYRLALRAGPRRASRDIRLVHRPLIASGRVAWLGEPSPSSPPPPLEDMARAVARVHALFVPARDPERAAVPLSTSTRTP